MIEWLLHYNKIYFVAYNMYWKLILLYIQIQSFNMLKNNIQQIPFEINPTVSGETGCWVTFTILIYMYVESYTKCVYVKEFIHSFI